MTPIGWIAGAALAIAAGQAHAAPDHIFVKPQCGEQGPCYTGIQLALDAAARDTSGRWITIDVAPGTYREKPVIARGHIRLIGHDTGSTKITFGAVAQTAKAYHRAGWGTPGSATLTIDAEDVLVDGITIENSFDYLANDRLDEKDPAHVANPQAAALLLDIHSDKVLMRRVALMGYQDTLFANGKRALIQNSLIAGNVDFIFGNGQLLIEDSEIRTRQRAQPTAPGAFQSFVAAPSTQLSQPMGLVFARCRLTREDGVPDGSIALARPWHPTTRFADGRYADPAAVGMAVFFDCFMDRHIHPDHWTIMNGTSRDGAMATVFRPQDSRFAESGSYGPGAKARDIGMAWRKEETLSAMRKRFLEGWTLPR